MKLTGKILIVDDDKVTLDFFDIMLTKLDYEVIKAKDGIEALEKVKIHNPDLMLLDNLLPKMTGFEVTQIIKKDKSFSDFKDLPIIMFSALDDPEDKVLGLEMGIEDYITKPFNFSEVLARIRNVIRHKELVKQLLKRERRLAVLESLNTNLIAFTRHIKEPLAALNDEASKLDINNKEDLSAFVLKFKDDYNSMMAMQDGIEEQIRDIENKKNKLKEDELSLEELEKKISKYLKNISKDER
ncbi:MAG TPA: response regulator [Spirochaetota bacterium]|nr:MAG: Alkaline phosphatase synthesis transcriptional regulatory protein PhoP [Spirochaetes bacterium ADurb.Bin133]HNZ27404.1 response regulator [Spirochaetota bacterium]HOF00178.1 response regulator [Spirochaetota bacterium]HOS32943.1 response regulator [Spirochaetota bacterium]HOS54891.1 response regulator [Spirochaetota bacterium]